MFTSPLESAILIKVPQVESLVGRHRRDLDPSAKWGVPAHVTLLYPFLPPSEIDAEVLGRIATCVSDHRAFEVQFARAEWFGEEVLWLAPEPNSPFRRLTAALISIFPKTPPYGGSISEPTPHLTVADGAMVDQMREVELLVISALPIWASFDSVSVMVGSLETASWKTLVDFPLNSL
jgi:hypothetical protein